MEKHRKRQDIANMEKHRTRQDIANMEKHRTRQDNAKRSSLSSDDAKAVDITQTHLTRYGDFYDWPKTESPKYWYEIPLRKNLGETEGVG
ncbi:hypothetical protein PoB_002488500 [Plakobranchus ocellatus]|uniref:Uncharacterized protein n=1 Tax=Plakobranchus ocellatus TaxID=259542 RepID=A0AAV3ZUS0_9GAST|nr:hypothetical protein PoB_002488500 [Plakobranchus ocellatus]